MGSRIRTIWQNLTATPFPARAALLSVLFLALSLGAIAYLLNHAAKRENILAHDQSRHIAGTALQAFESEVFNWAKDYAWWDATVSFALNSGTDTIWADDNIGIYLHETFDISGTYVVNADDKTIYSVTSLSGSGKEAAAFFGPQFHAVMEKARESPMHDVVPAPTYVRYDGVVHFAVAAAITSENLSKGSAIDRGRPVLILFKTLDANLFDVMAKRYLLNDLGLQDAAPIGLRTGFALKDCLDVVVAFLAWSPDRPGDQLMKELFPWIAVTVAVLILAGLFVFVNWWRTASEANAEKSRFLAKVSHELRTPLNPIIGFSETMKLQSFGPLPETYASYANDIHKSGLHLARIVQDVLDVSRIESGGIDLVEAEVDLRQLLNNVASMMEFQAIGVEQAGNPPEITCNIERELPRIFGDETRIRQVVLNLVSNAVKFSDNQPIEITAEVLAGAIRIIIHDHGIGISAEDLKSLFKPFVQVGSDLRQKSNGTGLGLVISRELMALHGGKLELQSSPGIGTRAIMTFPASRTV